MSDKIQDQAVMIGARKTLVGIMTQPADYEPRNRPVFVILNSGIIHRVGHHRMYVALARALAGAGYQVLNSTCPASVTAKAGRMGSPFSMGRLLMCAKWSIGSSRRARREGSF